MKTIDNENLRDALKRIKAKAEKAITSNADKRGALSRTMREIGEIAGACATVALFVALGWLYLALTPPQYSGECELVRAEMMEAAE